MGSKQALSNGNEPEELTALLSAFGEMNGVELLFMLQLKSPNGRPQLEAVMSCWTAGRSEAALDGSDYASVRCWAKEYTSLMGLVTTLLYKLDFELAEREWQKTSPRR